MNSYGRRPNFIFRKRPVQSSWRRDGAPRDGGRGAAAPSRCPKGVPSPWLHSRYRPGPSRVVFINALVTRGADSGVRGRRDPVLAELAIGILAGVPAAKRVVSVCQVIVFVR